MNKHANLIVDPTTKALDSLTRIEAKQDILLRLLQPDPAVTQWLLTIADREFKELNSLVRFGDKNAAKEMDVASKAMDWLIAVERTALK